MLRVSLGSTQIVKFYFKYLECTLYNLYNLQYTIRFCQFMDNTRTTRYRHHMAMPHGPFHFVNK
jgi:hypothetical protein